jgi:transketolase
MYDRDPVELAELARSLRREVIRLIAPTQQGYVQQGLGAADLLAVLFFSELRYDTGEPNWPERDRFILSAAHNSAVFYAALAASGRVTPAEVSGYCEDGSPFEINASERVGPSVEATCGSLGQGLSVGVGMALSARRRGSRSRVYVVLGDGELQEGQTWEALMYAGNAGLSNLCLVVDDNGMQVEGPISDVVDLSPLPAKIASFGWHVMDVSGHDIPELQLAFQNARGEKKRPSCILAKTIPGQGVPSLEGLVAHNLRLPETLAREALDHLAEDGTKI